MYRDHRKGPGGPPGGATYPGGPHGLKWEGNQPLVGWCAPLGPPPAPRVGNPRGGGQPTWLGGQATPLAAAPPGNWISQGPAPPRAPIYRGGGREGSRTLDLAPPFPIATPLCPADAWRSPAGIPAASTTTPSCCWIFINLSFPLPGSSRRRRLPNRTCVEHGGVVRSVLGSSVIWITTSTTPSTPFS